MDFGQNDWVSRPLTQSFQNHKNRKCLIFSIYLQINVILRPEGVWRRSLVRWKAGIALYTIFLNHVLKMLLGSQKKGGKAKYFYKKWWFSERTWVRMILNISVPISQDSRKRVQSKVLGQNKKSTRGNSKRKFPKNVGMFFRKNHWFFDDFWTSSPSVCLFFCEPSSIFRTRTKYIRSVLNLYFPEH